MLSLNRLLKAFISTILINAGVVPNYYQFQIESCHSYTFMPVCMVHAKYRTIAKITYYILNAKNSNN